MTDADQHRRNATNHLDHALTETLGMRPVLASMAVASALLAIEARLGELVEQGTGTVTVSEGRSFLDGGVS